MHFEHKDENRVSQEEWLEGVRAATSAQGGMARWAAAAPRQGARLKGDYSEAAAQCAVGSRQRQGC